MKLSELKPDQYEVLGSVAPSPGVPKEGGSGLKLSDFHPKDVQFVPPPEPDTDPKTSPVTAAMTGLIQGAVPFAAPIAGAGKAALDAITGTRGPLAGGSLEDLAQDYRDARDTFAKESSESQEANPKTALAATLAGGGVNPAFAMGGLKGAAAGGALQALGASKADLTKGEIGPALKDTAFGAGAGAAGYGLGKMIAGLPKKALTILGPSEEAINARLAGGAKDTARSYPELAEDMAGSLKTLQEQISEKAEEAAKTLSDQADIPKAYVTSPLDEAIQGLKLQGNTIGPTDKRVESVLNGLKDDLQGLGNQISEQDLKSVVRKMDDNINWDDQSQEKLNNILKGLRSKFDSALKFKNEAYGQAMEPVSSRMDVLDQIRRKFNFRNKPGEGLVPQDTTASSIQSALKDNRAVSQENLARLKDFTGRDYFNDANDYRLSQQFDKTGANGSRRTVLGAALGGLVGHGSPAGLALGGLAGGLADTYGGQFAGKIIDKYLAAGQTQALGKFGPILKEASQRGPEALAVTTSLLSRNPEFQNMVESLGAIPGGIFR